MVRPRKWRLLSPLIKGYFYKPRGLDLSGLEVSNLNGDELEAMRLCDMNELEQSEAGSKMGISRPTVQRLLYSGRKKIAEALLNGWAIRITFPSYVSFYPDKTKQERR